MKYLRYKEELDAIFKKPKEQQQSLLEAEELWVCDRCGDVVDAEKNNWDYDMYCQEYRLCPFCREKIDFEVYGSPIEEETYELYVEKDGKWVIFEGKRWEYENLQRKLDQRLAKEIEKISGVNYGLLGPIESKNDK